MSAPEGSRSELVDAETASPTLFVDLAGAYVFALTVQNAEGLWDATPDLVEVTALPADGFYVELSWHAGSDLDLHLMNGTTPMFGFGDCSYCNMAPSWGVASDPDDDPSLDWDANLRVRTGDDHHRRAGGGDLRGGGPLLRGGGLQPVSRRLRGDAGGGERVPGRRARGVVRADGGGAGRRVARGDDRLAEPGDQRIDLLDHTTRTSCR